MIDSRFAFFNVASVPDKQFDKNAIFDIMWNKAFLLVYDFSKKTTMLGIESDFSAERAQNIMSSVSGLKLSAADNTDFNYKECTVMPVYSRLGEGSKPLLADLFDMELGSGCLAVMFIPLKMEEIKKGKAYIEKQLSKREASQTMSFLSGAINKRSNTSIHRENFSNSEELMFLTEVLESLNASVLRNGTAYEIYFLLDDATGKLEEYVSSRFLVFQSMIQTAGMSGRCPLA